MKAGGILYHVSNHKYSGYIFALTCVLMWSFIPVVSRLGQSQLDNFQFLFWSNVLSLVVVAGCMFAQKGISSLKNFTLKRIIYVLFLGALGCAVYYLCLYYGYAKGNSIKVLILQYSWPLQIILLSVLILKEKISLISWTSIAIGFTGIVIVLTRGNIAEIRFSTLDVSMIVLAGAFCFALFSVLSKKMNAEPFAVATLLFVGGSIVSTISLCVFSDFRPPGRRELIPVIVNGALINGASYLFWLMALDRIPGSIAAVIVFLAPVLSAVWIVLFFDETFYPAYAIGLILVLAAGFMCLKSNNTQSK